MRQDETWIREWDVKDMDNRFSEIDREYNNQEPLFQPLEDLLLDDEEIPEYKGV